MITEIKIKQENDRLFEEGAFEGQTSEYYPDFDIKGEKRSDRYRVDEHTVKLTTIGCIIANRDKNCLSLNFANPVHAGGGYIMGARAQEESICRASGLYYTISTETAYYRDNIPRYTAGGRDNFIYSSNVPVIRDDSFVRLDDPIRTSFITSAAVNRYASLISHKHANEIMEQRIRKIISFAVTKEPEMLILGAYGCGAFGNRRDEVLPMFERAINDLTGGCSAEIVFAIP
ncbi:MAG: TIGR02452 family protein [Oscillospiraceae bacterium]|nr:TIGR02452 family protein [Oscillospiraceae bacterium]